MVRPKYSPARTLNPSLDIRQADVEAIPFPDNRFDFILCIEVLRDLPDPLPCLRGNGSRLEARGRLHLRHGYAFAQPQWLLARQSTCQCRALVGNLVSLKQFFATSRGLRRDLTKAGFSKMEVHGVYLGPINWLERLLPRAAAVDVLRHWESVDGALADRWLLREFSNMFLLRAKKGDGNADA